MSHLAKGLYSLPFYISTSNPSSMTDQDPYRPRSPDFSSFQSPFPQSNPSPYPLTSPLAHRASYDASPFFAPQHHPGQSLPQQYVPPGHEPSFDSDMARRSSRIAQTADVAPIPDTEDIKPEMPEEPEPEKPSVGAGVDVKTKFPVARIKRIMQADEDVGKVAQVTPIAVCKYSLPLYPDRANSNSESPRAFHDLPRLQSFPRG